MVKCTKLKLTIRWNDTVLGVKDVRCRHTDVLGVGLWDQGMSTCRCLQLALCFSSLGRLWR